MVQYKETVFYGNNFPGASPFKTYINTGCCFDCSMKKGCVVEIRHSIPGDSPFKTYLDIKKYWKNVVIIT